MSAENTEPCFYPEKFKDDQAIVVAIETKLPRKI